ncbi:MAG: alpha/beta hydrolase, partial [Paramuribaculum sp.]|nr:alpha/beta hydrolase [Paramuribaculum sp.]
MADGYIESRMADHIASGSARRTAAPMGIRKGVAAALSALSLVSVTTFAQGRVVEVQSPSMRVYVPSKPSGMALVACPGGGYSKVAADHEGYDWAPFFNSLGVTYAVLDYTLPDGDRSRPINDVAEAFRVLVDNGEEWHVDISRTGIMGFSAGGHLAAAMANGAVPDCRPAFQILFYPVVSLMPEITHPG